MSTHTDAQVRELADAMWQLLDDMGKDGQSVCLAAKAQARIAYEPFADFTGWDKETLDTWMPLDQAKAIAIEIDR